MNKRELYDFKIKNLWFSHCQRLVEKTKCLFIASVGFIIFRLPTVSGNDLMHCIDLRGECQGVQNESYDSIPFTLGGVEGSRYSVNK